MRAYEQQSGAPTGSVAIHLTSEGRGRDEWPLPFPPPFYVIKEQGGDSMPTRESETRIERRMSKRAMKNAKGGSQVGGLISPRSVVASIRTVA